MRTLSAAMIIIITVIHTVLLILAALNKETVSGVMYVIWAAYVVVAYYAYVDMTKQE